MNYTVHGILQARILEWVALPISKDLPNPEIEMGSPALEADSLPTELSGKPWEDPEIHQMTVNQVDQNDWPKETQKKYPVNQTTTMSV